MGIRDEMAEDKSDLQLLEAWAAKDKRAGDVLIRRYFATLNRFFANKVAEDDQADLIQSTLLECTRSITRFRGDAKFRTYLLSIARNVLLHHYRQRSRKLDRIDPLTHTVSQLTTGVFTKLANARDRHAVLAAMRQLPLDFQIVLELKYWERLTASECAIVLGIPANTVSGRIRRGKEKLRQVLDQLGDDVRPDSKSNDDRQWMQHMYDVLGGDPRDLLRSRSDSDDS